PSLFQPSDARRDLMAVVDDLCASVQPRHLVVDNANADMVWTGADVAVSHIFVSSVVVAIVSERR
ncbi:MAG TPA: hypothetical protein VIG47_03065, partial [Gemmatimonadaceae bacterium]